MALKVIIAGIFALHTITLVDAHMKMTHPVPFGVGLERSPLDPNRDNFPCQYRGASTYQFTAMNKIPVNEPVLLSFDNGARHEGGTCEISVSMDKEPTKESVFKVIQVFEGGCPPNDPEAGLTFNLPGEFPTTERATLAWTWFNKVGNREMYMNCAPIQVTGGSDNMEYYNSLPEMFVANLSKEDCATIETHDPIMPDPGQFVIQAGDANPTPVSGAKCGPTANNKQQTQTVSNLAAYTPPSSDSNQIITEGGGAGGASSQGPQSSANAAGSEGATQSYNNGLHTQSMAAPTQAASTAAASGIPYAPSDNGASSALPTTFMTMTSPVLSSPADMSTAPSYPTLSLSSGAGISGPSTGLMAAPSGYPSTSNSTNGSSSCGEDGAIVCNGPDQFGLCNHGSVVWQAVAAGTTCSNGVIQKRSDSAVVNVPKQRRHAHVRHHSHGAHKLREESVMEGLQALRESSLGMESMVNGPEGVNT